MAPDPTRPLEARLIRGSRFSADPAVLAARKLEAERALRETSEEMRQGRIGKTVTDHVESLVKTLTGEPPPGPAGTVVVRVVGVPSGESPKVPLPGLWASLKIAQGEPIEAETDMLGQALLRVPDRAAERFQVAVNTPAGKTIARKDGSQNPRRRELGEESDAFGVTMLFEVEERGDLASSFRRAEIWGRVQQEAFHRAEIFQKAVDEALLNQKSELSELRERLDRVLRTTPP